MVSFGGGGAPALPFSGDSGMMTAAMAIILIALVIWLVTQVADF